MKQPTVFAWIPGQGIRRVAMLPRERPPGPELLDVFVHGNGIPELRQAALDVAADLYGPDAELEVQDIGSIANSSHSKGKFCTHVRVRCLNFPGEVA